MSARQPRVRRQRIGQAVYQGRAGGGSGGGASSSRSLITQVASTPLTAPVHHFGDVPQGELNSEANYITWGFTPITLTRPAEATTLCFFVLIKANWTSAGYLLTKLQFSDSSSSIETADYNTTGDSSSTTTTPMAGNYSLTAGQSSATVTPLAAMFYGIGVATGEYYYQYWWA